MAFSRENSPRPDPRSVFLNVPFDRRYSPLFLTAIVALTALGRKPRCVLEVPSAGSSRLERIFELISGCEASIHDLSRAGLSGSLRLPRFNMPFELGLACSLSLRGQHQFFVFEEKPFRLQATLSDLNGHDPHIHGGTQLGMLRCTLDCFGAPSASPPINELRRLVPRFSEAMRRLQAEYGVDSPFHPSLFRRAVDAAGKLAQIEGWVE